MSLTLVTGLFDIGRHQLTNSMFQRSFEVYKNSLATILSATPETPIIIFCEPSLDNWISQYRQDNYQIIHKSIEDIRAFKYFDLIQAIRTNPEWYNQSNWIKNSPAYALELYLPVVMSKQYWMLEAVKSSVFPSDHYLWIDAGFVKIKSFTPLVSGDLGERMAPYLDKMLYLNFKYRSHEIHGFTQTKFDQYAGQMVDRVSRGGVFGGPAPIIQQITTLYDELLQRTLSEGYMGTEENIFTLLTYLYPELCNIQMTDKTLYTFLQKTANISPITPITGKVIYQRVIDCSHGDLCGGHIIGVSNESGIPE